MAAATIMLVIGVLVVGAGIAVFLRSWVAAETRTESHLHDPHTHTVAYAVPSGVDPAVLRIGLGRAGFATGFERVGEAECMLVECERADRERLRGVLEDLHTDAYDSSELSADHVVFEDER